VRGSGRRGGHHGPPALRRVNVLRPRLLERLRGRFGCAVTVVVAPAGFGKTTLLAQAVAENALSPAGRDVWLTCSPDDVVGSSLAGAMCEALGISAAGDLDAMVDAIVDATWHPSPDQLALVLDDVHEIAAGSPGAELLTRLVDLLPDNVHFVFAGRQQPAVPLSRLEVEGHVLRLSETDLLLTADELAEVAARRNVSVSQLAATEGWPALAELAASALPGVEAAYLWEEVLAGIPTDRRRDLALLAHLGPVDDDLASVVLGRPADVALLTAGLPLVATTADGFRRIHTLWRPHFAKVIAEADIAEARRRAGLELARVGELAAGIRMLVEARAWDDVAEIVVETLGSATPAVAGDVVSAWLGTLPEAMAGGPLGRFLAAVAEGQTDPRAAIESLEAAAIAFRDEGNPDGELACMTHLAQIAWWSEEPERLMGLVVRVFEMESLGHDRAMPLACLARALIADVGNDSATVLAELDRIPPRSLHPSLQSMADWLRTASLNHLGLPVDALDAAETAQARATPLLAPLIEGVRLQARWFLGDVDAVVREMPGLLQRTIATGLRHNTTLIAVGCSLICASSGLLNDASRALEVARRAAGSTELPIVAVNLVIAEAMLAVARGDESGAAAQLRDHIENGPPFGAGLAAFPQRRSLVVWYVLAPATRDHWRSTILGPCFVIARDLAEALVALREAGRLPAHAPRLPEPGVTRSLLPLPWATELALGYVAADRQEGWTLLESLWPRAQPSVRRHADDPAARLNRPARTVLSRLPVPPGRRLQLNLLGQVELCRDGELVDAPDWRRERVRSLLAHLALHRSASRERLADDLWPNLDGEAQSRNLRVTLTRLLRVLEPERSERDASFFVRPHGNGLRLEGGEWFDTDVWQFDELSLRAHAADDRAVPSAALDALLSGINLWRGDPSELAANPWALADVEQRRLRLETMATRAGELLLAQGRHEAAGQVAEVVLRSDPWSQRGHEVLVAAHEAAGNRGASRRARARYRSALAELDH
jgi:DNA-binding SARP family transcriptional activator